MSRIIDIIRTSASLTTLCEWFDIGQWGDLNDELALQDIEMATQGAVFPCILLRLPYSEAENEDSNFYFPDSLNIYFINTTDPETKQIDRHDNDFPTIRTMKDDFKMHLRNNGTEFTSPIKTEHFFSKYVKNKLQTNVDVIHLNFTNLKYFKNC